MSTRLATAILKITTDNSDFDKGLKSAGDETKSLQERFKGLLSAIGPVGVVFTAITGAVTASTGAMAAMTKVAADYGDAINKSRVETGLSTEALSKWKFVADQTESSFEGLTGSLKFLAKNSVAAADGTKEQADAFKDLGVKVTDASGHVRPMNDLVLDLADAFSKMPDGPEKAALALKIFGKSGTDMIGILNLGRAGIVAMGDQAEKLGLVLSGRAAKAGDDFNDSLTGVKAAALGLSVALGGALMPTVTSLAQTVTEDISGATKWAKAHEGLTTAIFGTATAITGAGGLVLAAALGSKALNAMGLTTELLTSKLYLVGPAAAVAAGAVAGIYFGKAIREFDGFGDALDRAAEKMGKVALDATTLRQMQEATDKLAASLRAQGVIVERGTDSISDYNARVLLAAHGTKLYQDALAAAHPAIEKNTAAHKKSKEQIDAEEAAAKKLNDTINGLVNSVVGDTEKTRALTLAIGKMEAAHVPAEAIAERLKNQLMEQADTAALMGRRIDPLIIKYTTLTEEQKKTFDGLVLLTQQLQVVPPAVDLVALGIEAADTRMVDFTNTTGLSFVAMSQLVSELKPLTDGLSAELAVQVAVNKSVEEANKAAGISVDLIAEVTGQRREEIMAIRAGTDAHTLAMEAEKKAAESYQRVWETALGNVTSDTIRSFSDILFHGGKFKHDFIDIFKSTAEGAFSALMTGFFAPVENKLAKLGGRIAASIFGGGKSGGEDEGGGAIPGLAGVAGGSLSLGTWGSGAASKVAADGTVFSTGGTGGTGLLGGAHALLTNPWTAVVGAGIIATVAFLKSQAHHEANTWVKRQNQFDAAMAAATSLNQKHGLVASYLSDMKGFAGGGSDEHLVATQARATFLKFYGDPTKYGVTMPQFHMGTPFVPETRPYLLERGERVTSKVENESLGPLLARACALQEQMCALLEKTAEGMKMDGQKVSLIVSGHFNRLARNGTILQPLWRRD